MYVHAFVWINPYYSPCLSDVVNLRKFLSFLSLVIFILSSGYASIFWFSGSSALNVIYLKIIGVAIIPGLLSFGWMALWKESDEPFTFHMIWNATSQILLLGIILSQIQLRSWGLLVWGTVLLTIILLTSNFTGFSGTENGFSVTGFLILLNVVMLFSIVLTSFSHLEIVFLIEPSFGARLLLKAMINEVAVMGYCLQQAVNSIGMRSLRRSKRHCSWRKLSIL